MARLPNELVNRAVRQLSRISGIL